MAVMAGREDKKRLDGRVEMDDVYLGGHRPGRRGRGAAGKQPFVAAVSTSDDRRPRKIKLLPGDVLSQEGGQETSWPSTWLRPAGSVTDGLRCWTAAAEAGLEHTAIVTGSGRRAAQWSPFKWAPPPPPPPPLALPHFAWIVMASTGIWKMAGRTP